MAREICKNCGNHKYTIQHVRSCLRVREEKKGVECEHDFENALHPARATWICPKCKDDISIAYVFWYEAVKGYDCGPTCLIHQCAPCPCGANKPSQPKECEHRRNMMVGSPIYLWVCQDCGLEKGLTLTLKPPLDKENWEKSIDKIEDLMMYRGGGMEQGKLKEILNNLREEADRKSVV